MKRHKCKSWTYFYDAIALGIKTHDLRNNDRNFEVGDVVTLQRYDQVAGVYTGEEQDVIVTYITSSATPCAFSSAVLDRNYCILSIRKITEDIQVA